eukprot:4993125-Pleurochrysis_carterae.AAC.6
MMQAIRAGRGVRSHAGRIGGTGAATASSAGAPRSATTAKPTATTTAPMSKKHAPSGESPTR